jgi:integrase/recombinase XerD
MRICSSGIRLFYHHVLERDWKTLDRIRAESAHRLPAILSLEAVRRLLTAATPLHNRVYCTTVSSCGLRLPAALSLQVRAIASPRHTLHVHRGQGAKDRSSPLPHATLELLRLSWQTHRNPTWLFPATGRDHTHMATATSPMSRSSVQGACRKATQRAGIIKRDVGVQTLRHCYATPLLEAGVNLRAMQRDMGHAHLETTRVSLHLTHKGHEDASQRIDALRRGFQA